MENEAKSALAPRKPGDVPHSSIRACRSTRAAADSLPQVARLKSITVAGPVGSIQSIVRTLGLFFASIIGSQFLGAAHFCESKTLISSKNSSQSQIPPRTFALLLGVAILGYVLATGRLAAQIPAGLLPNQPTAQTANPFQGSVAEGEVSSQPIGLSLDEAIERGLKANLGIILSGTQTASARGQRLSQLQSLLPSVDASGKETVSQVDLPAEGLRIKGFPTILGPFGYTDVARFPELVAGELELAAQLPGRASQLCCRATLSARCEGVGGADSGQCLPAGAGR